jgi:CheY-like chemotaxis protein
MQRLQANRVREGQAAVSVPAIDKLPSVIDMLIKAVAAGELDEQLGVLDSSDGRRLAVLKQPELSGRAKRLPFSFLNRSRRLTHEACVADRLAVTHDGWKSHKRLSMAAILIVEDDEQVRVLADSVLQEAGHNVIAAMGVEGATALLQADEKIDVVFLDLMLGGDPEAGLRFAQDAKAKRPELSFLYTTGSGVNAGMKALFVEPYLFLPKPYTMEQLTQSVEFLLLNAQPRKKADWPPPESK